MLKRALFFLVVAALLTAGGYYVWGRLRESVKVDPPQMVAVRQDTFVHEILGRGSVDSAQNEEVRVRVESAGQGGLTIETVIPEGTLVKKGDQLATLSSSWLAEQTERQLVVVISSRAKLGQSQAELKTAELTLTEYKEATFIQNRKAIENEIFTATEQVKTQEDNLVHANRLYERGYIKEAQVVAYEVEYEKAVKTKEIAEIKLDGLKTFTKNKMETQYEAAVETAKAKVEADEQTLQIDNARLEHLQRQLANCTIYAPSDGQIVYYMPRWGGDENLIREGKRVLDKDILFQLPDPNQMQVKGLINEANVRHVSPGQKATIRLEAFLNRSFEGEVTQVNAYPEPAGWMGGGTMSKEYLTTVKILNSPEGVKTGLTAEARIVVNEIPNALLLPTQAVFRHGEKMYVLTFKEGKWDKVEVKTGHANDKDVVILEGLNEGDEVVLGAWVHRDKVDLPKVEEEPRREEGNTDEEEMLREQMRRASQMQQGQPGQGTTEGGQQPGGGSGASPGGAPGGGRPGGGGARPGGGGGPR